MGEVEVQATTGTAEALERAAMRVEDATQAREHALSGALPAVRRVPRRRAARPDVHYRGC